MRKLALIMLPAAAALLIIITAGNKIIGGENIKDSLWGATVLGTDSLKNNSAPLAASSGATVDVLQQFQNQIKSVNAQLAGLNSTVQILSLENIFKRTLKLGDKESDFTKLQE